MNVERILREYPTLGEELVRLNRELNERIVCREEDYNTLCAQNLSCMPKAETPEEVETTVERAVLKLTDRFDAGILYYTTRINDIIDTKDMIDRIFADREILTQAEKRIVELRCFICYDWATICRLTNYSRKQASRLFTEALNKIEDKMNAAAS